MSSSSADRSQALDVGPDVGGGRSAGQLAHQMFRKLGKEGGATTGHQVTQGDDGAFSYSHTRAYELCEEAAENRLMEARESSAQPTQMKHYFVFFSR